MPSPFPGMDPFLEATDLWPDVHARLIDVISELLMPKLRPKYVARVELRTFLFKDDDPASELYVVPDVRIVEGAKRRSEVTAGGAGGVATAAQATAAPIDVTGLISHRSWQRFLEIRDAANRSVVTIIEVISPSNKFRAAAGRRAFQNKRHDVSESEASWLEIDLLRNGAPTVDLPTVPRSAYRAYADRTLPNDRRQWAWPIRLRDRLPILPVPLRPSESDVPLDLQAALDTVYERAGYDVDLDYSIAPDPPLEPNDADWADALLREKGLRS